MQQIMFIILPDLYQTHHPLLCCTKESRQFDQQLLLLALLLAHPTTIITRSFNAQVFFIYNLSCAKKKCISVHKSKKCNKVGQLEFHDTKC